jgi:predicted dehydrogenase
MTATFGGRTLLIGLGGIGVGYDLESHEADRSSPGSRTLRTHAAAVQECPTTVLVGGVDPREARRTEFEAAFGVPSWASIDEVPATDVEIVVVATPTETHAPVTAQALTTFSPRLLLCEKPVGTSAAETRSILALAQQRQTTVVVNYFRNYLPAVREVREMIHRGDFGDLLGGSVIYSHGLRRNGSHFVAMLLWLIGDGKVCGQADLGPRTEDPAFTISFGVAAVNFTSIRDGLVRAAEICLGFSRGLLRFTSGGRVISWSEIDADTRADFPSYSEVRWERRDDMSRCQLPVYEWLTSPNLVPSDIAEHLRVALRTQELVDEVTRDAGQ